MNWVGQSQDFRDLRRLSQRWYEEQKRRAERRCDRIESSGGRNNRGLRCSVLKSKNRARAKMRVARRRERLSWRSTVLGLLHENALSNQAFDVESDSTDRL